MQTIGHSVNRKVWLTLQSVCGECYAASVSYLCAGMCVCVFTHSCVRTWQERHQPAKELHQEHSLYERDRSPVRFSSPVNQ